MIDFIEWILDFFFDMAVETSFAKKVPRWLRLTMGIIVIAILIAIFGLLFYVGIKERNVVLLVITAVLILAVIGYVCLRKRNQKKR